MKGGCSIGRLVQGQTGSRDSMAATGRPVMLKVGHVTRPLWLLLLLGESIPCLSLSERIKPLSKALLWSHAIVVVAH